MGKFLAVFLALALTTNVALAVDNNAKIVQVDTPFPGSKLFVPNDSLPHPGILILHGSEGGSYPYLWVDAEYYAAHGYAAMMFCYFDCHYKLIGPHETLAQVEISNTFKALEWLKQSSYVKGRKTAVYGFSRGAEQSMLIAALSNGSDLTVPDAILAHAPADTVYPAWNWDWEDPKCWSSQIAVLKFLKILHDDAWSPNCGPDPRTGAQGKPIWETVPGWNWKGESLNIGDRIKVENYDGPIFISVGTQDTTWPYEQTVRIEDTLKKAGKKPEVHYFAGEDHIFSVPATNAQNHLILNFLSKTLQ